MPPACPRKNRRGNDVVVRDIEHVGAEMAALKAPREYLTRRADRPFRVERLNALVSNSYLSARHVCG